MSTATQERIIRPARNILGSLRLPGDKSISHRYAMLGAFAEGTSRFTNFSTGADCASTLACMQALGAKVRKLDDGRIEINGVGGRVTPADHPLDCGNSGSTMRMISGLLAPQQGTFTLIGDASLSRRPMERIRKPLEAMGARLTLTDGHAPLTINGAPLHAIDYTTPVPSAQVKTCVLLAGLQTAGTTIVREALRTRDHSELALRAFGATLTRSIDSVSITGPQTLHAIEAAVPGDISSAAFFLCAAALFPTPASSSTASASTPPAPRFSTSSPPSARASPSFNSKKSTPNSSAPSRSPPILKGSDPPKSAEPSPLNSSTNFPSSPPSLPTPAAASAFATRRNCASRSPTASPSSRAICAPWVPKSRSSKMASTFPAANDSTAPSSTPAATTASPWLSASLHFAPKAKP